MKQKRVYFYQFHDDFFQHIAHVSLLEKVAQNAPQWFQDFKISLGHLLTIQPSKQPIQDFTFLYVDTEYSFCVGRIEIIISLGLCELW